MTSLLEQLEAREAAARARVEALEAELDALAGRLAAEQELVSRLAITRQTVLEVLAGGAAGGAAADNGAVVAVADADPAPGARVGASAGSAAGRGVPMQVPALPVPAFSRGGGGGRLPVLPVAYRDVVEVLTRAGRPLRAMQICQALGMGGEDRHREGMRSKLKRLVRRGWLVEAEPGLFACASGVAATLNGTGANPGRDRRS